MAFWSVASTLSKREAFAAERLEDAGFEIFAPKTKTKGRIEPLFPGYLFVRIADRWRAVDRTLGVLGLIKFGNAPAKCPDAEVASLRAQIDAQGLVRLPPRPPKPPRRTIPAGAKVKIAAGPFQGVAAL